ncbi:hypothetical protein [Chryseobacterium binzhouense]|uniref:hypothetical protein n=1 Tax=Chryseobacterium binzhouense TaxID=2593646 RepID=UPI002896C7D3|nr:hypothetical protein [Chryseobacterium binzhouense]
MEKLLAYRNDYEINQLINKYNDAAKFYFNDFIKRYQSISILPELQTDDLVDFFRNPKSFFLLKLTKGETLKVGDLKLSSEKVFELLERPEEIDMLINDIEALKRDRKYMGEYGSFIVYFEICEGILKIKQNRINEVIEKYSRYIESEKQIKALKMANSLVSQINELLTLCDVSKLEIFGNGNNPYKAPLERIFKGTGGTNKRIYEVNLKSISDAF